MAIFRVKARWTGFSGAPGLSVFHFNDSADTTTYTPDNAVLAVRTFFFGMANLLPTVVTIDVDNNVEVIDPPSGQMTDIISAQDQPNVVGAAAATYSAPSGAVVHWTTSGVRNGRRVRGKTFLVPLVTSVYQNDGTLATAHMATIAGQAQALIDNEATALVTYSRPVEGGQLGQQYLVTGQRVPDMAAVLRSRRD